MGKGYYSKGYYHDKGYGCCRICCLIAAQVAVSTYLFGSCEQQVEEYSSTWAMGMRGSC